jgi:hypothetical protein
MRFAWAIPCRYAEVVNGMATIVGAGANVYTVPAGKLPAPLAVMVVTQLAGGEDELEVEHHLRGQVLGPDMESAGDPLEVQGLRIPVGEHKPPGWEATLIFTIVMQWVVKEPGTYTLELAIDDRTTTVPILVNEASSD